MGGRRWTEDEEAKLLRLRQSTNHGGVRLQSELPGRTPGSISAKLSAMELVDPVRSARARDRTQLPGAKHREFVTFLRDNIGTHPPETLTRLWNEQQGTLPGAAIVTHDMTRYWVRKTKIGRNGNNQPLPPGYTRAKKRRYRLMGKKTRNATDLRVPQELARLRRRRTAVRRADASVPMQNCSRCTEDWPHTVEFFREKKGPNGPELERHTCRYCGNTTRRKISRAAKDGEDALDDVKDALEQERRARRTKQAEERRAAARKTKKEFLAKHRKHPVRCCLQCEETWPLLAEYFAPSPHTPKVFSFFCRFCDSDFSRACTYAAKDEQDVEPIRAARAQLLQAHRDRERAARRKALEKTARGDRASPRQQCPQCTTRWPLTEGYWYMTGTGTSKVPAKKICRCCVNDNEAAERRAEKA